MATLPQSTVSPSPSITKRLGAYMPFDSMVLLLSLAAGSIAVFLFTTLRHRSIWLDEAYTVAFVAAPWPIFTEAIHHLDGGTAFYYLLARVWAAIFGPSLGALRAFSALCALAAAVATYRLAGELGSKRVAVTATALLLVSPFWIQEAQNARPYSLAALLAVLSTLAFLHVVRRPARRTTMVYLVAVALTLTVHLLIGVLVVVAHAASFSLVPDRRLRMPRALLLGCGVIAIVAAELAVASALGPSSYHVRRPTIGDIYTMLSTVFGRKLAFVCLGAAIAGALFSIRSRRSAIAAIAMWAFVPIVLLIAGAAIRPSLITDRYCTGALPFCLILAASGVALIRNRFAYAAATIALIGVELIGCRMEYKLPGQDFASASRALIAELAPGDVIAFQPRYVAVPFSAALDEAGLHVPARVRTVPADITQQWKTFDYDLTLCRPAGGFARAGRIWSIVVDPGGDIPVARERQSFGSVIVQRRPLATVSVCP